MNGTTGLPQPHLPTLQELEAFDQSAAPVLDLILTGLSSVPQFAPIAGAIKLILPAIRQGLQAGGKIQSQTGATPDLNMVHQLIGGEIAKIGTAFHQIAAMFHPPAA